MKPNRLIIEAFGPYAERAEIDFDALADTRLFVVSGPTGAGKTSIFDAMCWALYGELPGNRFREGRVRSDAAAPGRLTSVDLTFTVNDTTYRVRRQPEQERPKVRGAGTTTEKQQVELHRRVGTSWEPVSHKWGETNRECARLVGLSAAQFQQVVLLPQGRFQEVLHAGSADRTELLRTLFDTAGFARAQDLLDERAKAAEARHHALVAEVAQTEDVATTELDALEALVAEQGIEVPAPPPAVTATTDAAEPHGVSPHETAPGATAKDLLSDLDGSAGQGPVAARPIDRDAGRRRRRRGRPDMPGQLSLVPDEGFEPEPAPEELPTPAVEAVDPAQDHAPPVRSTRGSLDDRATHLERHGVGPLERRRDRQRHARSTAEAHLNQARRLAERQATFHADRALLDARVQQLDQTEADRARLRSALRAAGVGDAHQASRRAAARLTDAASSASDALNSTADHLATLIDTWPEGSEGRADARPTWLADAMNLSLCEVPTAGRERLATALEALAQHSDRRAGDLRSRAGEIAQATNLARQAAERRSEATAAAERVARLDAELGELDDAGRKLDAERDDAADLAAGVDRARAALTAATELRDARAALDEQRRALVLIDDELAAVALQASELAAEVDRVSTERAEALELAGSLADHRSAAERTATALRLAQKRDRLEVQLADAEAAVRRGAAAYSQVMAAFTADAAPRLAETLVDDEDCPVCGSIEHPRPATAPDGIQPVSSADLERAHATNMESTAKRSALQDRLSECRGELGEQASEPVARMSERHQAVQRLVERSVAAEARAADLQGRLEQLAKQRQALDQQDRTAHGKQAAGRERLEMLLTRLGDAAEADAAGLEAEVVAADAEARRCAAAVESVDRLDRQRAEHTQLLDSLKGRRAESAEQQLAATTRADQLHQQASTQLAASDADWPHAELARCCETLATSARSAASSLGSLETADRQAREADASMRAMLARQGFDDVQAALDAQLDEPIRNRLQAQLNDWDREGFALTERLVDTVDGGLSLDPPDLDALGDALARASESADRLTEHVTTAHHHAGRARAAIEQLDGQDDERAQARTEFEAAYRLARMCRGHNAGRVTLEAWVLAHHLREVVIAANRRLGAMSRGRFQIHVDDEAADQRAKHGLDLSIADAETGTRRPARTLSGGQTFQASLSLALGLADTIAVQRVGRDIGATFIDEGFGGLDSDSLDTAIEVLNDLGAEGQMIGVITHVEEMKAGLPVAIEVTPLGGGRSRLTQLIGDAGGRSSDAAPEVA
ncbi:MAG: SMC family ATPase [Microthrixaceae bacterium]